MEQFTAYEHTYLPEGLLLSCARNRDYTSSLAALERARDAGVILEGTVLLCDAALNLHVDFPALPGVHGVIPREEAVWTRPGETVKDIAILTRVGKPVCFKVLDILPADSRGVVTVRLSRRAAQAACAAEFLPTLLPGDIIRARVTHLESFGAFVDIGCGLSSLLSVDAISVSRITHPRDRLWNGQLIWAAVRSVESVVGSDGLPSVGRIFVSTRELLGTWEQNAALFEPGQTVSGIVRSVEDYGIFVELTPNLAGLAELRDTDPLSHSAASELIGRTAAVFIKSILPERMKIKLVLIDAPRAASLPPVPPARLTWYIHGDTTPHIDRWVYSPAGARKRVETVF